MMWCNDLINYDHVYSYEVDKARHEYLAYQQLSAHNKHSHQKQSIASAPEMTASELNALDRNHVLIMIVKQISEKLRAERQVGGKAEQCYIKRNIPWNV